jgi:PPOX class probable F420-dependent enzyme
MTGLRRRLVTVAKGPLQAARSPRAEEVLARPVRREETFASLAGGDHVLLVTYTRDGRAIPTPVWFALDGDRTLYVWTEIGAVKAKRLRRDPSALLARCDVRGVPLGDPIAARGRILEAPEERERAERVVRSSWNLGQRLFARGAHRLTAVHYLAFEPAAA